MTTCPVCNQPMPFTRADGYRPRSVCSQRCAGLRGAATTHRLDHQVDQAAIWRLTHGDPVASTKAERLEAVRVLLGRGVAQNRIAEMLRVTSRSVWRYSHELRNQRKAA